MKGGIIGECVYSLVEGVRGPVVHGGSFGGGGRGLRRACNAPQGRTTGCYVGKVGGDAATPLSASLGDQEV